MKKKSLITILFPLVGTGLFAQIDPGSYSGQTFDSLILASPDANAEWIFDNATFTNSSALSIAPGEGNSYKVKLYESDLTLSALQMMNKAADSSSLFEIQGSADKRSSLTVTSDWKFGTWLSDVAASNSSQEIRASGYADIDVKTLNVSSDSKQLSGSALINITGASNTFKVAGASYIGSNTQTAGADYTATFQISGIEGAKSTATFGGSVSLFSSHGIVSNFKMMGNSEVSTGGTFTMRTDGGTANFKMEGSGNKFTFNGSQFAVSENSTAGTFNFEIGGSNNELDIKSTYDVWFGNVNQGKTNVTISGSGHIINFDKKINFRAGSQGDARLLFAADANGISTINAAGVRTFVNTILEIDFTSFVGDGSGVYELALISATSDWSGLAEQFVGTSEDGSSSANVIMGDNGIGWEIKYENNQLIFSYTYGAVPEPAACAAIFGALALAIAAYRRRK